MTNYSIPVDSLQSAISTIDVGFESRPHMTKYKSAIGYNEAPMTNEDAPFTQGTLEQNGSTIEKDLFGTYILDRIKSHEDAAKQLVSVIIILMGIYVTFMITNLSDLTQIFFRLSAQLSLFKNYQNISSILLFIGAIIPLLLWSYSLIFSMEVIITRRDVGSLHNNNQLYKYLINENEDKRAKLRKCYIYFFVGMVVLFAMIYFAFGSSINNTYYDESFYKGYTLDKLGEYELAIRFYNTSIENNPSNEDSWNNKGICLYKLSRYAEAIQAFDNAIELNPQYANAWSGKGVVLNGQGKYDEAIKAYDEAIRLDPKSVLPWTNKGLVLNGQGKYDEAIKAYEKAIEIDSNFAPAWYNKGAALGNLGKTTESNAAFTKAKELGYTD